MFWHLFILYFHGSYSFNYLKDNFKCFLFFKRWGGLESPTFYHRSWMVYLPIIQGTTTFIFLSFGYRKKIRNIMMKITNIYWAFFVKQKLVDTIHCVLYKHEGLMLAQSFSPCHWLLLWRYWCDRKLLYAWHRSKCWTSLS